MKYLKLFDNHAEYEGFVSGETMVRPNVSHCVSENDMHYNGVPYVTVIDVENIVKNSTTDKESHAMTYYYENSAFNYGTTYTNINPTFHLDGYNPIYNEEFELEGFYERYVTDEMSDGDNKCYIYRNPSTDEWFFYCNGDRGSSVYWIWAFSEMCGESSTFCTKYVPNKAYVRTNVNTPMILPPSIVSVNGVEPNGILSGDVKNVTVVLNKSIDLTKYFPDVVSMQIDFGSENTIVSSEDGITWIGEFEETLSINENIGVYLFGVDSNNGIFGVCYAEFTSA